MIATDLRSKLDNDEGKEIGPATLCTFIGTDCKRIMNSLLSWSTADKKDPAKIVQELKKHFIPQRNVLYERFVFNSAVQKPGETIDEYVVRLRQMAESCEFGMLEDSLIRDRIVIGTTDEGGRERLLRERPLPNLEKAIESHTPWLKRLKLDRIKSEFRGPGNINLSHLFKGQITNATLQAAGRSHRENVYVMSNQANNLLSKPAIQALRLRTPAAEVHNVEKVPDFRSEYTKLFKGLGLIGQGYRIPLKQDAAPVCLYTPRRVPHPLLHKVKEKLDSMVHDNVISPVTVPTDWYSGMVITPKRNGDVRICVDLTNLNKAVKRAVHPMASVDENLTKVKNSKVFSKLDANSGFWQVPLAEESRLLTTFLTPLGRYCFNRVPFRICSAPEVFQRTMFSVLEGLEGVICHMDDTLIDGPTQEVHDTRVRLVLNRLQNAGITLNNKCEFSKEPLSWVM